MVVLELRIGAHHRDHALQEVRRSGVLDELLDALGAVAVWVDYDDSRRTIDLLCAGDLHLAGTGAVPPLRGQSEGVDLVYVATSGRRSATGAIVAAPDGPVGGLRDLRGRRVGLTRGSVPIHLLAAALDGSSVTYRDLDVILDVEATPHEALATGAVDAYLLIGAADPALCELP